MAGTIADDDRRSPDTAVPIRTSARRNIFQESAPHRRGWTGAPMRRLDEGRITLHLDSLAATERLAARLAAVLRPGDALLLEGPLGAGKSALARAVLRRLSGDPALEVPSPSFTLVQSYDLPERRSGAPLRPVPPVRPRRPRGARLGRGAGRASFWWNGRTASARCDRSDAIELALAPGTGEEERVATLSGPAERLRALPA